MTNLFLWLHVAFGLLFIMAVLIQDKGTGLTATFGGTGGFYATQRGAAKVMHIITIVFAVIFFAMAMLVVVAPKYFPNDVAPINVQTEHANIEAEPVAQ